jgi:hypothetical protein
MKPSFLHYTSGIILALVVIAGLYAGGYFLSVGRSVSSAGSSTTPTGTRTLHVVSADLSGWKYRLFAPALAVDRSYVRLGIGLPGTSWFRAAPLTWSMIVTACGNSLRMPNKAPEPTAAVRCSITFPSRHITVLAGALASPAAVAQLGRWGSQSKGG